MNLQRPRVRGGMLMAGAIAAALLAAAPARAQRAAPTPGSDAVAPAADKAAAGTGTGKGDGIGTGTGTAKGGASAVARQGVLRVCQDPNNLPFSNSSLQGFENKIAALLAQDLGWTIEYTWYPQRMGFIRNTLRAKDPDTDTWKCDLVTGVAAGFDMGATTRPYYRSSYAMAYVKGKGYDSVRTLDDLLRLDASRRATMRLGVFGGSPVADWLLEHGLIERVVTYQAQTGDPAQYPGQMIERDLAGGAIDIAFIWGPIAGYYARQAATGRTPIVAIPLRQQPGTQSEFAQFEFDIVMATRFGEAAYKQRIDEAIARNQPRIDAILAEYGVPRVPPAERAAAR